MPRKSAAMLFGIVKDRREIRQGGYMEKYLVLENIEIDGGYKIDFAAIEKRIPEMDIPEGDKKALGEYVQECKSRDLTFCYQFSAFVKKTCGHWEHLQLHYADWVNDHIGNGSCTRCICGYWDRMKRLRTR